MSLIAAGKTRDLANCRTDVEIERGLFELPVGYRYTHCKNGYADTNPSSDQRPASQRNTLPCSYQSPNTVRRAGFPSKMN